MCGRYTLHHRADEIAERFEVDRIDADIHESYNVAPGQRMPVITQSEDTRKLEVMKWGLIPFWAKDPKIGYKLINARDDTIFEKPMWRKVILQKRCLIPADGFYEWKKLPDSDGKVRKQPFYIHPRTEELFSFAGVWETWKDVEGLEWKTYSIITTSPNREMKDIHDRMPVILHRDDEPAWLDPTRDDRQAIEPLLQPYEDGGLDVFEVSTEVNFTRNNDEKLIYPINSQ